MNVDQQTPFQGLLEVGYVGNRSRDQLNNGGAGGAGSNINLVPFGAMLKATNPATANANLYRPLQGYGDLNFATNNLYQNYNALAGQLDPALRDVHHPDQLHLAEGHGHHFA